MKQLMHQPFEIPGRISRGIARFFYIFNLQSPGIRPTLRRSIYGKIPAKGP